MANTQGRGQKTDTGFACLWSFWAIWRDLDPRGVWTNLDAPNPDPRSGRIALASSDDDGRRRAGAIPLAR